MATMPDVDEDLVRPLKKILQQLYQEGYLEDDLSNEIEEQVARRGEDDIKDQVLFRVITNYVVCANNGLKRRGGVPVTLPAPLKPTAGEKNCAKLWSKLRSKIAQLRREVFNKQPQPIMGNNLEPGSAPVLPLPRPIQGEQHMTDPDLGQNGNENETGSQPNSSQSPTEDEKIINQLNRWFDDHSKELQAADVKKLKELRDTVPRECSGYLMPFLNALIERTENQQNVEDLKSQLEAAQKNNDQQKLATWLNHDQRRQKLLTADADTLNQWHQSLPPDLSADLGLLLVALESREQARKAAADDLGKTQKDLEEANKQLGVKKDNSASPSNTINQPASPPVTSGESQGRSKWETFQSWCKDAIVFLVMLCLVILAFWLGMTVMKTGEAKSPPAPTTTQTEQPAEKTGSEKEPYKPPKHSGVEEFLNSTPKKVGE